MLGIDEERLAAVPLSKENPDTRFETLGSIGGGAYGHVYRCKDRATGEIVAIKQINITHEDDLDKVAKEICIMKRLSHPNIVAYRDAYCAVECLWIAMEYCSNGSVDWIFKGLKAPLPEHNIAYIAREVLQGLVYLHRSKTIHRDIKCGNVLVTDTGAVKLADFGVSAQLTRTVSRRNTGVGTFHWMAPEAIREATYNDKADVWSLGITCIEMAEMEPPMASFALPRLMSEVVSGPPPVLKSRDSWSVNFHRFLARCLVKDPDHRPSAQELLSDPFVSNLPDSAPRDLVKLVEKSRAMAAETALQERLAQQQQQQHQALGGSNDPNAAASTGSSIGIASARIAAAAAAAGARNRYGHVDGGGDDDDDDSDGSIVRGVDDSGNDLLNVASGNQQQQQGQAGASRPKTAAELDQEEEDELLARMKAMEEEFDDEIVVNNPNGGGPANSSVAASQEQQQYQRQLQSLKNFEQEMMAQYGANAQIADEDGSGAAVDAWHTLLGSYPDGVLPIPVLNLDEFSLDEVVRATHMTCLAEDDETGPGAAGYFYPVTTSNSSSVAQALSNQNTMRSNPNTIGGDLQGQQQQQQHTSSPHSPGILQQQQQGGAGGSSGEGNPSWTCFTKRPGNNPSDAQLMALLHDADNPNSPPQPPPVPAAGFTHSIRTLLKLYGMMRYGVFKDAVRKDRALRAHSEAEKLGSLLKTILNVSP